MIDSSYFSKSKQKVSEETYDFDSQYEKTTPMEDDQENDH